VVIVVISQRSLLYMRRSDPNPCHPELAATIRASDLNAGSVRALSKPPSHLFGSLIDLVLSRHPVWPLGSLGTKPGNHAVKVLIAASDVGEQADEHSLILNGELAHRVQSR